MSDLQQLIERVERLDKPSLELDALIMCAVAAPEGSKVEQSRFNGAWCIYEPRTYGNEPFRLWEKRGWERPDGWPVTASLDAAIALCERVLPGWACGVDRGPRTCIAFVDRHDYADRMFSAKHTAEAPTPALALCLATLRALEAQEDRP